MSTFGDKQLMKRTKTLILSLLVAGSITGLQAPAQARRGAVMSEVLQRGGRVIRNLPKPRPSKGTAKSAAEQFQSCVRGYRQGRNSSSLAVAQNLCAHLRNTNR